MFPSKDNHDWNTFKVNKSDLERETPVMVSDDGEFWSLAYYYHKCSIFLDGRKDGSCGQPKYIIKASDFDFEDSSSNINKSII